MTLYAIFDPKPGSADLPAAIPEKFSWFAALLPPIYLMRHGLWLELAAWVLHLVGLVVISIIVGGDAMVLVYCLGAVWLGFAAAGMRRLALGRRGWTHRGDRVALSAAFAQLESIR